MSKKPAAETTPKLIWFEDSKGFLRELPSDTPTRYGKECGLHKSVTGMFPLHEAAPIEDIEIHEGTSWISGIRVDAPKEMVFEVRVQVKSHLDTKEAVKLLQDVLYGRRDEIHNIGGPFRVKLQEPV